MATLSFQLDLPEEVATSLTDEQVAAMAREALVMELVRGNRISQGKAAEILGVPRAEFFTLMSRYQVPVVDMSDEELRSELGKPLT
ncbi:MAG: UPF0175 family protein [Bryobacteraceae bacterium]